MKYRLIFITFLFLFNQIKSQHQLNSGILPYSYNKLDDYNIDKISISAIQQKSIDKIVEENEKDGSPYKIGELIPVDFTVKNSGTITKTEDGKKIWRLKLSSKGAKACAIHFDYFKLQEGSSLFAYTPDYKYVLGPFNLDDNIDGGGYSIGILPKEDVVLEYILPSNLEFSEDDFKITAYSYIYRGVDFFEEEIHEKSTGYGTSGNCEVNVNCSEGNNWRIQQRGVVRIYVVEGSSAGWCSGSLINNTLHDGKPYILTAGHCVTNSNTVKFEQWRFYFNYESPSCTATKEPTATHFTGCKKLASAPLDHGSDFLLLEMKNANVKQLKAINAVYNGWDIATNKSYMKGVSIHHPSGDIKKISTYNTALTTSTWNSSSTTGASGAHWRVIWAPTTNGYGVTEGGSSGSPIFNDNGLIVGTLSGGSSSCSATDRNSPDYFGKISYHWESNGTTIASKLKPWLDPINSNAKSCDYLESSKISNEENGENGENGENEENEEIENKEIKIENEIIKIYPNPNNGKFNVYTDTLINTEIKIYNITGKELYSMKVTSSVTEIELKGITSGIYIVKIITDANTFVRKIICSD